jgi:hypothetical protein
LRCLGAFPFAFDAELHDDGGRDDDDDDDDDAISRMVR